jgi:glyoxylase-like metal-dependent hydrolase (beta-lactamase superfamily II)
MANADVTLDLQHLGRIRYVACQVLMTDQGPVLVDTGPGSTIDNLVAGLRRSSLTLGDLHAVLLTHIHLDHAGGAGLVAEANPAIKVYVHHLGAKHLIDPSKLIASATRVFGDKMDRYWGRMVPISASQLVALDGGETITLGGRSFEAIPTPGHAVHHMAYYERAERTAYVGDVGGLRVPSLPVVLPVTPPPDFDLEDWLASLETVKGLGAERIFRTHYGFGEGVASQLTALAGELHRWTEAVGALLGQDLPEKARADRFDAMVREWLADRAEAAAIAAFAEFSDFRANYYGIARYVVKRKELAAQ